MKKISYWGKKNPHKTRLAIVIIHILLICIGCYWGITLLDHDIRLSPVFLYIVLGIWIYGALAYPLKRKRGLLKERYYVIQKRSDLLLALSTTLLVCYAANSATAPTNLPNSLYASGHNSSVQPGDPTAQEILASLKNRVKSTLSKQEKRILKREFKTQLKNYVKASITGNKSKAGEAGLIILTIIAALGLLYLVAALACNLSCNGMDGAAIAVGLLGTIAIVWATIAIIRRINRGPKKKEEEAVKPEN